MTVSLFVPQERDARERRVALVPAVIDLYRKLGVEVYLEAGAGVQAGFPDEDYGELKLVSAPDWKSVDLVLTVNGLAGEDIAKLKSGAAVVGLLAPHRPEFPAKAYEAGGVRAFALERLPRITRAQSMDALSSQAAAAGYRAVLLAATTLTRFFPMLTTAAGTVRPARVLVVGAGVAGLQAIATGRRLGAIVEGYDVRPEAREQVESLGARFVDTGVTAAGAGGYARELTDQEKRQQAEKLAEHVATSHVVITTAAVPGKTAPRILTKAMVEAMPAGAVIVDLAAASGGNCELTRADEIVHHEHVSILGPTNAPSDLATHASEMYARNLYNFVAPWFSEAGKLTIAAHDEVYSETLVAGPALASPSVPEQ